MGKFVWNGFNTSHVTLYRWKVNNFSTLFVSIHLMLLFIELIRKLQEIGYEFQYISCYSLSESCNSWFPSTVTFQYISCYSLSDFRFSEDCSGRVSIHLMLLFIGKYYSSQTPEQNRFNTSHVTLYQLHVLSTMIRLFCFNTSHVTLYLKMRFWKLFDTRVSIHLMLLFI